MLQNFEKWLLGLSCLSAWNMAPNGWNFMKFDTWEFFEAVSRKFKFYSKLEKNNEHFIWRPMYIYDMFLNSS